MDELIRDLIERASLSEEEAKATAELLAEHLRDEERRKKIVTAAMATTIASAVVTAGI